MDEHADISSDLAMLQPIAESLVKLAEMLDGLTERVEKLEKVVLDDIIGGVTKLYNANSRLKGIEELRGKYGGELDEKDMELYKNFYGDNDPFEVMYDQLESKKGEDGFDAEGMIRSMLSTLKEKLAIAKPKAVEVEMETAPEKAAPSVREQVEKLKAARGRLGF